MLPLYHFFERLRQNEFPLGIDEYQRFLLALEKHFGLGLDDYTTLVNTIAANDLRPTDVLPKESLLRLCKVVWLKPNQSIQVFEELFEETFPMDFPSVKKNDEPVPATSLPETSGQPSRDITPPPVSLDDFDKPAPALPLPTPEEMAKEEVLKNKPLPIRVSFQAEEMETTLGMQPDDDIGTEKSKFLFTSHYYPIDRRKTQQNLKRISTFGYTQSSAEIDVDETIRRTIEKGHITNPAFKKLKVNNTSLMILVDHMGSMVAFEPLANSIRSEAEEVLLPNKKIASKTLKTFYFYNTPANYLYGNKAHTKHESFETAMSGLRSRASGLVIISDAGAARGRHNRYRINATKSFLRRVHNYTNKIAWLNPMPKERWANSSAESIAEYVAMFEATESGIKSAIDLLKGTTSKLLKEPA